MPYILGNDDLYRIVVGNHLTDVAISAEKICQFYSENWKQIITSRGLSHRSLRLVNPNDLLRYLQQTTTNSVRDSATVQLKQKLDHLIESIEIADEHDAC